MSTASLVALGVLGFAAAYLLRMPPPVYQQATQLQPQSPNDGTVNAITSAVSLAANILGGLGQAFNRGSPTAAQTNFSGGGSPSQSNVDNSTGWFTDTGVFNLTDAQGNFQLGI